MTRIFDTIIGSSAKDSKGNSLYTGSQAITLALGLSDFGRDYSSEYPEFDFEMSVGSAVMEVLAGRLKISDGRTIARVESVHRDHQNLVMKILNYGSERGFSYHSDGKLIATLGKDDLLTDHTAKCLVSYTFTVMKNFYLKAVALDAFFGAIGEKINGLPLTYFDTKEVSFSNPSSYSGGFYLHRFFAPNGQIISWKTGKISGFLRGSKYIIIGGRVKDHNRYNDFAPETIISRAKFFDTETGDKYIDPE